MPRCSRKQAWGSRDPPRRASFRAMDSTRVEDPIMAPATISECPLRYLVPLCRERSNPHSAGRKFTGLAKVLSMRETIPFFLANFTTALRSATCKSGFVRVSTSMARVLGRRFDSQDSGLLPSIKSKEIPHAGRSSVIKSCVPPYRQSWASK